MSDGPAYTGDNRRGRTLLGPFLPSWLERWELYPWLESLVADVSTNLAGLVAGKADKVHGHIISDVSALESALNDKSNVGHTHSIGNITDLSTALIAKADKSTLPFNIKNYGVKGDDVTDDAPAINTAINNATRGTVFEFPEGKYRLGSPIVLKTGVYLRSNRVGFGYLPGATPSSGVVLRPMNGVTLDSLVTATTNVYQAGIQGIDFEGLGTASKGINMPFAYWCQFRDIHMNNFMDQFILISAGNACVIDNFLGVNGLKRPGRTVDVGSIELYGTDHFLTDVETGGGYTPGALTAGRHNAGIFLNTGSAFLKNVVGELSEIGFRFGSTANGNFVTSCRADKNGADGWEIKGNNNVFAACMSAGNFKEADNVYNGFIITGAGNSFGSCRVFSNSGTNLPMYAYNENRDGQAITLRNTFDASCTGQARTSTWKLAGWESAAPIIPNNPRRYPAGTVELDVNMVGIAWLGNINAATTINSIINGTPNQRLTLISNNTNTTLANTANIKTTTGANKPLAANTAYTLTLYNGVWYEHA